MQILLMIVLFLLAIFLIVLVLIQRGKGGGLAGALGGMGGQSAFGTKAGDLFTRVTIGVAAAWILLCIVSIKVLTHSGEHLDLGPVGQEEHQSQTTDGAGQGTTPASGTESPGGTGTGGGSSPAAPGGSESAPQK